MNKKLLIALAIVIALTLCSILYEATTKQAHLTKSSHSSLPQSIDQDDIQFTFESQDDSYNTSTTEITLSINNMGTTNIEFGEMCTIEKYKNGRWYVLPFVDHLAFDMILNILQPQKSKEIKFDTEVLDYKITTGKYRVVKEITSEGNSMVVAAEFNILL